MRTGSPHNQLISRCIDSYYDTIIKNSKITVTQYYNDNKKTVTRYIRERYAEHSGPNQDFDNWGLNNFGTIARSLFSTAIKKD